MKDGLQFRVGLFTLISLSTLFVFSIIINKKPLWWKSCHLVMIRVEDATGLKSKSAVRSLGVDIGYLHTIHLTPNMVHIGICLTAPVNTTKDTKAFIRSEGFLGDKFIELKPLEMQVSFFFQKIKQGIVSLFFTTAYADDGAKNEITAEPNNDFNQLINRVDSLVDEVTHVATNIKDAINPADFKKTLEKINIAIENISKTVAPEGGLNQTAQRSLAKLEDAIEQLQAILTRVNKGEGSIGMLINDPSYAIEIKRAIDNINRLLDRVSSIHFLVDLSSIYLTQYKGMRAGLNIGIWTRPDRYYALGIGTDPRGAIYKTQTSTSVGALTQTISTQTTEFNATLFTVMIGKVYQKRLDLSLGLLYGYGTASLMINLGPHKNYTQLQLRSDFYYINQFDTRLTCSYFITDSIYLRAGLESFRPHPDTRKPIFEFGLGISFNDEDLKLLLALK